MTNVLHDGWIGILSAAVYSMQLVIRSAVHFDIDAWLIGSLLNLMLNERVTTPTFWSHFLEYFIDGSILVLNTIATR